MLVEPKQCTVSATTWGRQEWSTLHSGLLHFCPQQLQETARQDLLAGVHQRVCGVSWFVNSLIDVLCVAALQHCRQQCEKELTMTINNG